MRIPAAPRLMRFAVTLLFCMPLFPRSASATGNLDCFIDDKNLNFSIFALTGFNGGIVQVNEASIEIKAIDHKEIKSKRAIERKDIDQQWIYGDELRLRFQIPNAKSETIGSLILIGKYKPADDTYSGRYVLRLDHAGGQKELKGKMKCG
jgi:hypothetical protein